MPDTFKLRFKQLALTKKIILFGAALATIGVFLPWYSDIDRFSMGETFYGLSGPMYLAGIFVLITSLASFSYIFVQLLGKPVPKLPVEENYFHLFNSGFSLLMMVLSLSVYFHPSFGINLADKDPGIGLILGFIGSGALLGGVIWSLKRKVVNFDMEGHLEPLIDLKEKEREHGVLDKNATAEDALKSYKDETKVWGPVQQSLAGISEEARRERMQREMGNTKDLS